MSAKIPKRTMKRDGVVDLGAISSNEHNEEVGAKKVIIIEPAIKKETLANEIVGAGKLVKINDTSYGIDLLGKDYDSSLVYQIGDITANGGFVYMAQEDQITGAFDASKWKKVAQKQITGIIATIGSVVSTGRWHNAITVAGWLVDDNSYIPYQSVRD